MTISKSIQEPRADARLSPRPASLNQDWRMMAWNGFIPTDCDAPDLTAPSDAEAEAMSTPLWRNDEGPDAWMWIVWTCVGVLSGVGTFAIARLAWIGAQALIHAVKASN